ncbi:MAG TPA: hypothetical protein VFP95_02460 [Gammaproteobacteria bacterium]|nr:hypothetical protein [Gammaproteobacteria bacterium]
MPDATIPELNTRLSVVENNIAHISNDSKAVRRKVEAQHALLERMVRLEEAKSSNEQALGRAFDRIKSAEDKLDKLSPLRAVVVWLIGLATTAIGGALVFYIRQAFA